MIGLSGLKVENVILECSWKGKLCHCCRWPLIHGVVNNHPAHLFQCSWLRVHVLDHRVQGLTSLGAADAQLRGQNLQAVVDLFMFHGHVVEVNKPGKALLWIGHQLVLVDERLGVVEENLVLVVCLPFDEHVFLSPSSLLSTAS